MLLKTQGTQVWVFVDGDTPAITEITCVEQITGVAGGQADKIETTCLKEPKTRTYQTGLTTPADVALPVNYDNEDPAMLVLKDLNDSLENVTFIVGMTDGTAPPTLTAGVVTFPTTRTYLEFQAAVAAFPFDFAPNSVVKTPTVLNASGSTVLHRKTIV
jgi:hypothetical protein